MFKFKKPSKMDVLKFCWNLTFILIGSFLLAFGTGIFLTNLSIINGGLSGIAIIIQYFVTAAYGDVMVIDIVVGILTWVLWVFGLIFVGKDFAIKTLFATIFYPICLALILRIEFFTSLANQASGNGDVGSLLLCSLFGGVLIGAGVAITFVGGGSTGGVDVFTFMIEKYLHLKQSIGSFLIDGSIILVGMFLIKDHFVASLCGILSAFVSAVMIEYIYHGSQTAYQADIISDKWEEISQYVQNELGRGATIIPVKGGYQGTDRIVLRVVFNVNQYVKVREFVASIDPKAFMTITRTNAVYGEGFIIHKTKVKNRKNGK